MNMAIVTPNLTNTSIIDSNMDLTNNNEKKFEFESLTDFNVNANINPLTLSVPPDQ